MSFELQFRVLRLLEVNPYLSQRELSKTLSVNLGGVNYCLNALIAKGAIKIENFKNNKNKCKYSYLLIQQGFAQKAVLTGAFLKHKIQECQSLKQEIEALSREVGKLPSIDLKALILLSVANPLEQDQASGIGN